MKLVGVGFDPVRSGIFVISTIEIGMLTAPIDINLLVILAILRQDVVEAENSASGR